MRILKWPRVARTSLVKVTGLDVDMVCGIVFLVCIFYSAIGGIKAVMWTDTFQAKTVMYRVFRKNCVFFTIHCKPSLAYIAVVRDPQSSQRNVSVQSLPIGW